MAYTHSITVPLAWNDAIQRTREALADQGFGVLTEIDVRATFNKKLGQDALLREPSPIIAAESPGSGRSAAGPSTAR